MKCIICNSTAQLQMPLTIAVEGFVNGDLALKEFCYACMYQISIAYNNVRLKIPSNNLKALDGELNG